MRGRENIDPSTSYVFVANHQGAYDIFAIYGYLGHNFRWMMKKSLEKIPLVGYSCRAAGHIYVDNSSPSAVRATMEDAEKQLAGGMRCGGFPGRCPHTRRTHARFPAWCLQPGGGVRSAGGACDYRWRLQGDAAQCTVPRPGRIILTIHKPIAPGPGGRHELSELMARSAQAIESALPPENRPKN